MKNNQSGFTLVETLLVILTFAVIGFGGYYVWNNQHKTNANTAQTSKSETSKKPAVKAGTDFYAGWKSYTLKNEKLTFKYPSAWLLTDNSGNQGLTPNTDSVILAAGDGFTFSIDDGWDGGGDSLNLVTSDPLPLTFLGGSAYLVFSHPRMAVQNNEDPNSVEGATLMLRPSNQYGQNNTAGYFPQDKNAHGDPNINNGGSTMLIDGGYTGVYAKTFATVVQAGNDPEFKNAKLVIQSMHY